MKKLIVASAMALGFLTAGAQTKIGYINSEALMGSMPEMEKANKELQDYEQSLQNQYTDLAKEAQDKVTQFGIDSAKLTPSMKEIKRTELVKLVSRVQNYQAEAQDNMQKAKQDKYGPIQQKAIEAIKSVAKKNGYAYVLEAGTLLVMPPSDDILPLVKKELGITDAPVKAAPQAKKGN